jgi:hypothetical protein
MTAQITNADKTEILTALTIKDGDAELKVTRYPADNSIRIGVSITAEKKTTTDEGETTTVKDVASSTLYLKPEDLPALQNIIGLATLDYAWNAKEAINNALALPREKRF